jgi:SAM-dependent MidA family methyltransferase
VLNALNEFQATHSEKLCRKIRKIIESENGWIGFDRFMALALYAPSLGYYSAGAHKFGEQGDFITAPMIGPLFGRCLANQCAEVLARCDQSKCRSVVEFGAGTGELMLEILLHLESRASLPDKYVVLEISADLQERQRALIETSKPEYLEIISWATNLEEKVNGIIIANELLDAMPVKRFEIDENSVARELGVTLNNGGSGEDGKAFIWKLANEPFANTVQDRLKQHQLETGYQSEIGLQAEAWVRSIGDNLETGAMVLIDYGFPAQEYYHCDRRSGTLMCHFQHVAHDDPFRNPGLQDITAHVDFSAVSDAAAEVSLDLAGYCNQASFLMSLGILDEYQKVLSNDSNTEDQTTRETLEMAQQIKKLTLPHEMGELFKVIAFTRNFDYSLKGFEMQNQAGRL